MIDGANNGEQEGLLQFALEVAGLGYWELNITTQRSSRSAKHDQIFGYDAPLPEWTYPQFLAHVHEEDRDRVGTLYSHALETGQDWRFQCRILRASDRRVRWIEAHGRHFRDAQGRALRIIGTVADITERAEAETESRRAEQVMDALREAVVTLDRNWRITYVNAEAARINKKPREAFLGRLHWEEWPAAVGTELERQFRRAMTERVEVRFEERYYVPGEYDVWVQVAAYPDETEGGGGLHLVYRDITHEKERRADQIIDAGLVGILNFNLSGGVTEANDRFLQIIGYNRDDLLARRIDWGAMTPPELHARDEEALRELAATGKHEPFEKEYVRKDGTRVPIIIGSTLFPNSDTEGVAFVLDLTEQKQGERERERLLAEQTRLVLELQEASVRQRRFLREMLLGFTEGRLRLCESIEDLPRPLPPLSDPIQLTRATIRNLRKQVVADAEELYLPLERVQDFETAVGEAAMNAVQHGGGGRGRVHGNPDSGVIQVWVEDQGEGIAEDFIHRAIEQGWTTGGFGQGFFLMRTCADRIYLLTGPRGTTVVLEQERTEPMPVWLK